MRTVFMTAKLEDATDSRAALRQALVDAAERRIARTGLASLKARDLADEAGCALGMIYKLVPDLDALILAVNLRSLEMLDAALGQAERLDASDFLAPGDGAAVKTLVRLALAYFDFAAANELRWRAIFEHRMPEGQVVPEPHLAQHRRMFASVEGPLRELVPGLNDAGYVLLGRSLFSAVHGVVDLGLKEKLGAMPQPVLRRQTASITAATARGLTPIAPSKPQQKRQAKP
jgi:AcrR family transcriptional regulator